jgi:ABC-type multidrug transport system ATPase subunit
LRVDLHQLSKSYGRTLVLSNVSASLPPASLTAILGINGAGKTTLLRTLSGLSSPDSGEIRFDGEPLSHGRLDLRRRVLFLPDNPPVFPGTDILENVAAHLHLWQADQPGVESKVASWLDDLGLTAHAGQSCTSLSRGQRWKASLLALLAVDPDLWLLDEPFASGMDTRGLSVFRREAAAAASRGRSVLYTTQIPELAASFADAVALVGHHSVQILDPDRDFARDPRRLESLILAAGAP